jgi:hypothetical protein
MKTKNQTTQLAQSASALGAAILGFGLGAKWGSVLGNWAFGVVVFGAVLHVYGMYIMQMKNQTSRSTTIAKLLWASAWICLIALIGIIVYHLLRK